MPFIGEVRLTGFSLVPAGWARCEGQILSIATNTALFQVLGTTYGGNGVSTFALPDLRGRVPVGAGQGLGLTNRALGEPGGTETHTLAVTQLPAHAHTLRASAANGISDQAVGNVPARDPSATPQYATSANADLAAGAVASYGGSQPHNNLQPSIVVSYIIALQGVYPNP